MDSRYQNWFVATAAAVLLATGAGKVWSSFGQAKLLAVHDPLLEIPFGKLMLVVGLAEIAIAGICLSRRAALGLKLGLIAWMATNFLAYRVGLWSIGWHHPCACMGTLAGAIQLSDLAADRIMRAVLVYMLTGSYLLILKIWRGGLTSAIPAYADPALSVKKAGN